MVVLNTIVNVDWETQEERDSVMPLIAFEVRRALRELDESDYERGSRADAIVAVVEADDVLCVCMGCWRPTCRI